MSLNLSSEDLDRLRETSARMLSVLEHEDLDRWAREVFEAAQPLFGADRMFLGVPSTSGFSVHQTDPDMRSAAAAYLDYYHEQDVYLGERRRALGVHSFLFEMLARPEEYSTSEILNDWNLKHRLLDASGIVFDLDDGWPIPASFNIYHERVQEGGFGKKSLAMLQLLEPSFKAVIRAQQLLLARRADLIRIVDASSTPSVLIGKTDSPVHLSRTFRERFSEQSDESRILSEAVRLGHSVLAETRPVGRIEGTPEPATKRIAANGTPGRTILELSALPVQGVLAPGEPLVIVQVIEDAPPLPRDETIRSAIGLTKREAEVALLLSQRCTNDEIAAALMISPHTARRHTERILAKLGARSRRDVHDAIRRQVSGRSLEDE